MSDSFQTKPFLFQTEQVNCTCFSNSPKDKQKIFLSKNQSLNERTQHQSLKKQQKGIPTPRNQSESSKNKKKSLKKQKSSNVSQTSRNFVQQTQTRSHRNQQKEKQFLSVANIQSRRHSESEREHHRNPSNNVQFNEPKIQNYRNIQSLNEHLDLKLNSNLNYLNAKQQKQTRHFRQPQLSQINPFHQLQQFHLMGLNDQKLQRQRQKQGILVKMAPSSNHHYQEDKHRQKTSSTSIQWKSDQNIKNQKNLVQNNDKSLLFIPVSSPNIYIENSCREKNQPISSQRKGYRIDLSTRVQIEQLPTQSRKKYQPYIQREAVSIDRNNTHFQNEQRQMTKNNSKNSTRKQSINSMNRDHNLYHQKQNTAQNQQNFQQNYQNQHYFQNTEQVNPSQLSHSPVRTLNSFRGSKFSHRQKESITKKLNEIRMIPKQAESFDDQNQDNRSQISDVVGRGWNNQDNQNQILDNQSLQAKKNRIQFKTLTLFTRESQLNSKSNTKASQIKTGTQHSLFLSPKSQQMIKMYQFPLNQQGNGAYDLSYKNIEHLSQIKNKQGIMNRHFQGQKSLQKDQNFGNKKSRKSSLKYI